MANNSRYLENELATETFGALLCHASQGKGIITLSGDLGTGKTTLCRGLIRAFGHSGAVKSPTYTIVEPYQFEDNQVMHFDLYRLEDPEELEYLGFRDYLNDNTLCLIEWPEKAQSYLTSVDLQLSIVPKGEGRLIQWLAISKHGQDIANSLQ